MMIISSRPTISLGRSTYATKKKSSKITLKKNNEPIKAKYGEGSIANPFIPPFYEFPPRCPKPL
jgi:hypothetical protein